MQRTFGFGAVEDAAWVNARLKAWFGVVPSIQFRAPIDQLVKSSISGRTRDEVSRAAHLRLLDAFPAWADAACARVADIEAVIGDVTFPDVKARRLRQTLRTIAAQCPDFDLTFLSRFGVAEALAWLERLPGVGRKVSASTLNFSTLRMPAFVVDTHVLRVLQRFGFVRTGADTPSAYDRMMESLDGWSAAELAEFHVRMKGLGQAVCRADHAGCRRCVLNKGCRGAAI